MGKTGFEKATSKMFGDFGSSVTIAQPDVNAGPLSREQRDRMRSGGSPAPEPVQEGQGRGRPQKNPEVSKYVLMNFRVSEEFRQRIKVMAAQEGRSVTDIFEDAFELYFSKVKA